MHPPLPLPGPRALARSTALWLFGLCITLLLLGLWGRSVTGDETTLDESARAVLQSELVNHRLNDWLTAGVTEVGAISPTEAQALVESVLASAELDRAIDALVDSTVEAALAPAGRPADLNLGPAVELLEPAIDRALTDAALPIDSAVVTAGLSDLELTSRDVTLATSTIAETRQLLTTVVLIGAIGLVITGGIAVYLSPNRLEQLRSLSWRIALSGFTFTLMLRLGAWAVDPGGGRSPVAAGSAVVLRSNSHVPVAVTLVAACAGGAFLQLRRRRRPPAPAPVPADDSTGEQRVLTGV